LLPAHLGKLKVACHWDWEQDDWEQDDWEQYDWEQGDWAGDAGLQTDASTEGEVACWNHSCEGGEH
jgi:hypothetical protein